MGQIAVKLDEDEKALLGGGLAGARAATGDLRHGHVSHNVANDGNFSIQVICQALMQFAQIEVTNSESPEMKKSIRDYNDEKAFICHSKDHWLAIRKINGVWYNLNSTNMLPPGPQIIGSFYLQAFLESVKQNGYIIFVVRGPKNLPEPN